MKNRVKLAVKHLMNTYFKGKFTFCSSFLGEYICSEPACRTETRSLLINGKCIQPACKGKVTATLSEKLLNDTLRYLQGLFDVEKYKRENPSKDHEQLRVHEDQFAELKAIVDAALDESKYNKVDLGSIFSMIAAI